MNSPVVFVCGFLGSGSEYWGDLSAFASLKTIFVAPGPVSSAHDRACEIIAELRGGAVDYGQEHSESCSCDGKWKHARYGATHKGLFPRWSADNPIHIICHSFGGTTILSLLNLLESDHLGIGSNGSWVKSVSFVSCPLRGTQASYALGLHPISNGAVHSLSTGTLITHACHAHETVKSAVTNLKQKLSGSSSCVSAVESDGDNSDDEVMIHPQQPRSMVGFLGAQESAQMLTC